MAYKTIALLLLFHTSAVLSANILAVLPLPSPSHHIWNSAILIELAKRGHNVTVLSCDTQKTPVTNLTDLHINGIYEQVHQEFDYEGMTEISTYEWLNIAFHFFYIGCKVTLESNGFKQLMNYPADTKFDLIITEASTSECLLGPLSKFGNVPIVIINAFVTPHWLLEIAGSPNIPSYMPYSFLKASVTNSFYDRLTNFFLNVISYVKYHYVHLPAMDKLAQEHYGAGIPSVREVYKRVAVAMSNYNPVLEGSAPITPNIISVGGLQIKEPKPLPKDLQVFLDEAKDGAIFFSLGSNVKSNELPPETLKNILDAFKEIPQHVLWKFESDSLSDLPRNVKISKWLPQSDILAHPNIRLFISHCGLLSTHETVHRGVPVIGIPFIADQHVNIIKLEKHGVAVPLQFRDLNKETLVTAINTVLHNPSYKENMKRLSEKFRDNPMKPLDSAVYWIEYALRHKGASHMKPASLDLNMVQYLLLDVIALILTVSILGIYLALVVCRKLCCKKTKKMKVN